MLRFNKFYLQATLWLLGIEIIIALNVHDNFIRPFGGDVLVVILLYCLLKGFVNFSNYKAALVVLLFAFSIEIAQCFHIVDVLGLGRYTIARVIIGTTFAWTDLLAYMLGIIIVLITERLAKSMQPCSIL
ncbi:DUF2809 domain-containing protein [Mucilaginibacter pallidiroseus]|uniref:DUF2809 domain-containing protein n=1 Tax=Mucilaginibacter pallidiroseus TaxID=2599295 RepID=A0A563U8D6_9SPHI|nr:DUF2809 domain-containing protein [Mucilaginibacter pallidiroseus]TWR27605.1 DUF2809 domain-containing protein [Mucilaginibacter pallidiroseus]